MASSAMQAAKEGRKQQLVVLEAYENGEEVTFRNHQGRGFTCVFDPASLAKAAKTPKVVFEPTAVFLDAAANNDGDLVEKMIDEGMNCNVANADGLSALHQCCIENNLKLASTLVLKGANINARDNDWWTPLHAASACGHWRVVNFLLSNGADLLAVNADGDLPVDIAEGDKVTSILNEELSRRDIDEGKLEAARGAAQQELLKTVQTMVAEGKSVSSPDRCGVTPLHVAACNGWLDVLELCVEKGADLNAQDEDGNTPLHLAAFFLQYKAVELLAKHGADVEHKNRHLEAPLVLTEDGTMIRLLKAIAQHQELSQADATSSATPRTRTNSSVKRTSMTQKMSMAKADTKREGSTIESNYAQLDFGGRAGKKKAAGDDDDDDQGDGKITYAVLDLGAKKGSDAAASAPAEAVYAQPVKASSPKTPEAPAAAAPATEPTTPSSKAPPKLAKADKKKHKGSLAAIAIDDSASSSAPPLAAAKAKSGGGGGGCCTIS